MTVIAGLVNPDTGHAVIAADTRVCWGEVYQDGTEKLYPLGAAILGSSGARAFHGYLRNAPPLVEPAAGLTERLVEDWLQQVADGMRDWARIRGHGTSESRAFMLDSYALVVTKLGVWEISCDGAFSHLGYAGAQGGGAQAAMAVLHFAQAAVPTWGLATVVQRACEAVCMVNRGCGGEIQVLTLGAPG